MRGGFLMNSKVRGLSGFLPIASCVTIAGVFLWAVWYFVFYLGYPSWKHRHHGDFVLESLHLIEPAAQMDEIFDDCRHYLTYAGTGRPEWNAVVFLNGRYKLQLQVPLVIDSPDSGAMVGPAKFFLLEMEEIVVAESGRVSVGYRNQWTFGINDWNAIYENAGDFSVVGIEVVKDDPIENFATFVSGARKSQR